MQTGPILITGQPDEDDLAALAAKGYVAVVNLRNDGEEDQPLSTSAEGGIVRALGMDYLHQGIGGAPLSRAAVEAVGDFLDRHHSGEVLVHCRKGSRAAALVLLHEARAGGWPAAETLARGEAMGLKLEGGLRTMVEHYLASQAS